MKCAGKQKQIIGIVRPGGEMIRAAEVNKEKTTIMLSGGRV